MAAYGTYLEGQLISHLFRTSTFAKPVTIAIALCTTTPVATDSGAFTVGVEVTNANAYTRVTYNPLDANWAANSNGTTSNSNSITWASATGSWGTINSIALCDNITFNAGNMLFFGTLTTVKVVNNGDTFSFASAGLAVSFA